MFPMTIHTIISIFIVIMVGYVLRKLKIFGRNFIDTIADSLYKRLIPFFFFWIITNETSPGTFGWKVYSIVLILLFVAYLSGYLIAHISKMPEEPAYSFIRGCYRFNLGLGLALLYFLFDRSVVRDFCFILLFVIPIIEIFSFLDIIWALKKQKKVKYDMRHIKHIVLNPIIIGGVLGWISSKVGIVFPIFINRTAEMIISIIFPLILIITGGALKKGIASHIEKVSVIGTASKIIILPLLAYLCLTHLVAGTVQLSAVIIFFTVPSSQESKMVTNLSGIEKYNFFVFNIASIVFFFLSLSLWVYMYSRPQGL